MTVDTLYSTIAEAETAIVQAGYVRDHNRHVFVNEAGKTAKVVRTLENGKVMFFVQRG